ncbi:FAD-dependent monooxygenase [Saccharomonospora cyanea]|uniref:2-polyprenyl-6-methoxyphenol hydroxylase-like oxidoreductase n=1 Tax=Saccharomonospora cyanea NA-134 TaxID=882082 RepID=H5XPC1_9PSEU|nr:FAD-dependent monooxygenase [Saccharomonospora cyanea]EHR58955.1 2-polyprenyl-6-methoxyphenol hydroxylase-like oxidoreductase [Saccharomonospora cyanea NA-134]
MTRDAIVVGGGIGGLAAALALHRIGWRATVLERAPEAGEIGAGMSQSPNALRALAELGVEERARSVGVPTHASGNLRLPDGRYLQRAWPNDTTALVAYHRADLHRTLLDALPAGWVRTGSEVTAIRQDGDSVTVACGETELSAELVVAADGIRSTVRGLLWPDAPPPRFLGRTAWLGIAEIADLPGSMTLGPEGYFLIHPISRGRAYWAHVATADEPGVRYAGEKAEVVRRVATWHEPIPQLIAATPDERIIHIDIHDLDPLPTYVRGRVALLGDAAHAMSPDRGQGAGQSIEDAVVLAAALADEPTIAAALARYDTERRPRTQATARGARADGRRTTSRAAHRVLVTMIRLMPAALWRKGIAPEGNPTWRWQPPHLRAPDRPH